MENEKIDKMYMQDGEDDREKTPPPEPLERKIDEDSDSPPDQIEPEEGWERE